MRYYIKRLIAPIGDFTPARRRRAIREARALGSWWWRYRTPGGDLTPRELVREYYDAVAHLVGEYNSALALLYGARAGRIPIDQWWGVDVYDPRVEAFADAHS